MTITDADRSDLNASDLEQLEPAPPARRQIGQRLECFLEGREDEPLIVRTTNRERLHYERTAAKHKWPKASEAQNLAMTFVCWSAAQRAGDYAGTFDQWSAELLEWELLEETPADPTRPTPSPGGTSN